LVPLLEKAGEVGDLSGLFSNFSFLLVLILGATCGLFAWTRIKTYGRAMCYILEPTNTTTIKLLKVVDGEFMKESGDEFWFNEEKVRFVRYPAGMPTLFQVTVPGLMFQRGRAEALDWVDLGEAGASSKEMGSILDPHMFRSLIAGVSQQSKPKGMEKMVPLLALVTSGLTLVFLFYLMQKINAIQSAVHVLKP
jgi:hypothetical protein